jgi:hypothetical protein
LRFAPHEGHDGTKDLLRLGINSPFMTDLNTKPPVTNHLKGVDEPRRQGRQS